ncbi:MAG: sugar ABC transporter ATP-binding protein, partial [Solirubrobacteraceae bacterium]
ALHDVTIVVDSGEVLGLVGENGSGKSTLAKIIAGAVAPDGGELALEGRSRRFGRPRDALASGIALVSQEPTALPELTIGENVMLPSLRRAASRFARRAIHERARPYLEMVGLDVDPARRFATLRTGERELAEIAKALACTPRLLILDEVTTRMPDPEALFAIVERLRGDGVAAIFISHRLPETRRLADRVVVLRDGHWIAELPRAEVDDERLATMMVGRELKARFRRASRPRRDVRLRVEDLVVPRTAERVSLEARGGEVLGIAGLVGAGRSELLETIAGARPARHGRIAVDGTVVRCSSTAAAIRAGIVLVPEDRIAQGLVLGASLTENVTMGVARALSAVRRRVERQTAANAVKSLRIRAAGVDVPVRTLSGGNQQKLVLARAINRAPRVLLLDEPTRGVDVGAKEEIYHLIEGLVESGMAVLLVSSDLPEVIGLADRILVMYEHRLVGELSGDAITEEQIVLLSTGVEQDRGR